MITFTIETRSLRPAFIKLDRIKIFCSLREDGDMKVNGPEGEENRNKFLQNFLPPGAELLIAEVVHKASVVCIDENHSGIARETDAVFTREEGKHVAVTFADCIPVFLFDHGETIAAAIHCSYKTLRAGIIPATLNKFWRAGFSPWHLKAATGPGICGKCYDFGAKDIYLFKGYPEAISRNEGGVYKLNLRKIIKRQLEAFGMSRSHIHISSECTFCSNHLYFSARKEGMRPPHVKAGMAIIGIT